MKNFKNEMCKLENEKYWKEMREKEKNGGEKMGKNGEY